MNSKTVNKSLKGFIQKSLLACAVASSVILPSAHAQTTNTNGITTVFYILLENRNWTQNENSYGVQILGDTNDAPFLNALVNSNNPLSAQVSFASCYHHVLATTNGTTTSTGAISSTNASPSVHPSEPNYVWMEAGNNLSKYDDNDPYGSTASVEQINNYVNTNNVAATGECLSQLLQNVGVSWKSYTEGVNQLNTNGANFNGANGTLATAAAPRSLWTVPLVSFSGTSTNYVNPYNGSHQYNFAVKHTGQLFFPACNGSTVNSANTSTNNVAVGHYPPLPQLAVDLSSNTCAAYNVITPDQYNDMHTALTVSSSSPWTNPETGIVYTNSSQFGAGSLQVAQGDNFCKIVVGQITNSAVYQAGHAAIVIWTDETEGGVSTSGRTTQNDFNHTLAEIVISPLAKGHAYNSLLNYTHSSDIATWQKVFGVTANSPSGFLNDAANASFSSGGLSTNSQLLGGATQTNATPNWTPTALTAQCSPTGGFGTNTAQDLSDLFQAGVIPSALPGLNISASGLSYNSRTHVYTQTVKVQNVTSGTIGNPVYLVVGGLSSNATLTNKTGNTVNNSPGSPYVLAANTLAQGATTTVALQYTITSGTPASTMSAITTDTQP